MVYNNWCIAFPGRDAIQRGMSRTFYEQYKDVKLIFEEASDYLNIDVAKMCYGKSQIKEKWQTVCLITHCFAIYKIIRQMYGLPNAFVGYSQGEFTACAAGGLFKFSEVLRLVYQLENLLLSDTREDECMYRIVDLNTDILMKCCEEVAATGNNICISGYISDTQNIVSGKREHVEKLISLVKQKGARWAIRLESGRAYHCSLCNEAALRAIPYFNQSTIGRLMRPIYSCYDGGKCISSDIALQNLSKQVANPIQWKKIIYNMLEDGICQLVELGSGCTVSANSRTANEKMMCKWIGNTGDLW